MKWWYIFLFFPFFLYGSKPNLLLLKVYKDQNISGWVMSEKLDGIRAYWDGKHLMSRGGKIIHAPWWFLQEYPPFAIDGELWSKRGDFENISSIVRDKVPGKKWKEIKHYIFEVPNAKGNLFERLAKVKPYEGKYIKIIPQKYVKNKQELQQFLKHIEKLGGEGVVVRDPNAPYIAKRTNKALKVKSFLDTECKVVGYTQGKGKYEGLVGALKCQLPNGILFKIGSGLSKKERQTPPKIGSIVTFKYKELTKYGKPKFPIFLRTR
ncbi:DNA ligase (ATP) [hydrothermal vent metagenome]|uniref:DNA ligase (ATP) n=1 Tax=hydrothermal vent metagenome TaxID=652676 RepID=A0A1W1D2J7_9ZZZZ